MRLESFEDGRAVIAARGERVELELPFEEDYNVANTVAAVAAASALGVTPSGRLDVAFSSLRGEIVELDGGVTVVNDCYNANPMSMRAALEHLAASSAEQADRRPGRDGGARATRGRASTARSATWRTRSGSTC